MQMTSEPTLNAGRERPILFSGPMVRAILDGKKTQTRRVVKFPDAFIDDGALPDIYHGYGDWGASGRGFRFYVAGTGNLNLASPYGIAGDRLWVRETWAKPGEIGDYTEYRADNPDPTCGKWRPSIFMPRERSRLMLEIQRVTIERLQAINENGAVAEGIERGKYSGNGRFCERDTVGEYAKLWDSLNAKRGYGWDANPWVWVIEFKALESAA